MSNPTIKPSAPTENNPATVRVPEPLLLDLLIGHVLIDHIVPERPIDIRPDRVLELLTDHLLEIPIEHEVAIPVEWALDHMLEHLFEIEAAMEEAGEMVAEEMGVNHV